MFKRVIVLVTVVLCCVGAKAQSFDSVLSVLDAKYPQEKLHLHFDREVYSPGETIWFKAYIFAGPYPSLISRTLYAELLDDQGKLIERRTSPVMMSAAAAAFDIPANLTSSFVQVRAYTRWMLNFDSSFLFQKNIALTSKAKAGTASNPTPAAFLQFFPEGGNLVAGIQSRVAFKATDSRGLPIVVKGNIVNGSGKQMGSFASVHDGMGYFMLQPQAGERYKAVWKDQFGRAQETALPEHLSSGIILKADNLGDKVDFTIYKAPDAPYQAVYVVAQMQQQLLYRAKANLTSRTSAGGSIPLENLPAGILQVTLFSEDEKPLAERIVFVNQQNYYFITDLNSITKGLTKRAQNIIQIDVPDTIACNLSVSVTDASLNPPAKSEQDIFSSILLTSDIKGYVHQPAYYFSESDSAVKHLDLVMLTNGWRRFRWDEVLAGRWPQVRYEPEGLLAIHGKVSGIGRPALANKEVIGMLQTKDGGRYFINIPVRPDGSFSLQNMVFFDTARILYQFNNDKDKILTSRGVFEFRNNLMNQPLSLQPDAFQLARMQKPDSLLLVKNAVASQRRQQQEDEKRKVQTLAAVEVTAKQRSKKDKMEDEYTSGMFKGHGNVFIMEDDPFAVTALNVFYYLQTRVPGLQVRQGPDGPVLSWRGGSPGLYMDEMQMDAASLQSLPMNDVAMIKVFPPPFFGGLGGGAGGAIAVYTKRGRGDLSSMKGLDAARIPGYSPIKEFYSPDYSKYNEAHADADYRKTLYWNPFVITDKQNRRIVLTFYNNDITNRIRVVIEGCDVDGKLTRIEKIFE